MHVMERLKCPNVATTWLAARRVWRTDRSLLRSLSQTQCSRAVVFLDDTRWYRTTADSFMAVTVTLTMAASEARRLSSKYRLNWPCCALDITASIIQGSAIGPSSFVVHAADLWAARAGSFLIKYADDRPNFVIIPACNVESRQPELDHICEWSKRNNLMLNRSKSAEIVFSDNRKKRHQILPPPSGGSRRGLGWA